MENLRSISDFDIFKIVNSSTVGVIATDKRNNIIYWNNGSAKIFKIGEDVALNTSLVDLLGSESRKYLEKSTEGNYANSAAKQFHSVESVGENYVFPWKDKYLKIDGVTYERNGDEFKNLFTIADVTKIQNNLEILKENTESIKKEAKDRYANPLWVRKTILYSLFGSIFVFSLMGYLTKDESKVNRLFELVNGFSITLSAAIGYYFKEEKQNEERENKPIYTQKVPEINPNIVNMRNPANNQTESVVVDTELDWGNLG